MWPLQHGLTLYNGVLAALLWPLSYWASLSSGGEGHALWFSAVSGAGFIGALVTTIGALVGIGTIIAGVPRPPR